MPNFLEGLPKEKVQLLYILKAAKAEQIGRAHV